MFTTVASSRGFIACEHPRLCEVVVNDEEWMTMIFISTCSVDNLHAREKRYVIHVMDYVCIEHLTFRATFIEIWKLSLKVI